MRMIRIGTESRLFSPLHIVAIEPLITAAGPSAGCRAYLTGGHHVDLPDTSVETLAVMVEAAASASTGGS